MMQLNRHLCSNSLAYNVKWNITNMLGDEIDGVIKFSLKKGKQLTG